MLLAALCFANGDILDRPAQYTTANYTDGPQLEFVCRDRVGFVHFANNECPRGSSWHFRAIDIKTR